MKTAEEQASWHLNRAYIERWFSFCIAASWIYSSAALSEGKDLNINWHCSCLWLQVFEVNWIDSYFLLTFISLPCVRTLRGHNEEKVIRPDTISVLLAELRFDSAAAGIIVSYFFCLPLFLVIPLWPAMTQVLPLAVSAQDLWAGFHSGQHIPGRN